MRISYWSSDVCFPISTNRPARQMMCARDVPWERQEAWSSRYRSGESTGAIHRPTTPCGHDLSKACCIRQSRKYCASWAAATPDWLGGTVITTFTGRARVCTAVPNARNQYLFVLEYGKTNGRLIV